MNLLMLNIISLWCQGSISHLFTFPAPKELKITFGNWTSQTVLRNLGGWNSSPARKSPMQRSEDTVLLQSYGVEDCITQAIAHRCSVASKIYTPQCLVVSNLVWRHCCQASHLLYFIWSLERNFLSPRNMLRESKEKIFMGWKNKKLKFSQTFQSHHKADRSLSNWYPQKPQHSYSWL